MRGFHYLKSDIIKNILQYLLYYFMIFKMRKYIFHVHDLIYYPVPQICNFTRNGEILT